MRVMGLDEAGRGAVLGPLVVGAFTLELDGVAALAAAGATDSKKLSAARRQALIPILGGHGTADLRSISAREIDRENLNELELRAFVSLIREHRPDRVIIDAPCHPAGIPNFIRRLRSLLDHQPELVVEPKADLNHAPCGAASIFAKVRRDAAITALEDVGSGYPSDPVTRAWLKDFIDRGAPFPACVRTRWGTIANLSQTSLI